MIEQDAGNLDGPAVPMLDRLKAFRARLNDFQQLSNREIQVLQCVALGFSNQAIAEKLGIVRVTVQNHRARIRGKLGIEKTQDYLLFALAFDLLDGSFIPERFRMQRMGRFQSLSHREREVLRLLGLGMSNTDIAETLYLARMTVETHRKNIKTKLDIRTTYDLMCYVLAFEYDALPLRKNTQA